MERALRSASREVKAGRVVQTRCPSADSCRQRAAAARRAAAAGAQLATVRLAPWCPVPVSGPQFLPSRLQKGGIALGLAVMSRPSAGREGEGTAPRAAIASVSGTSGVRRLPRAHHSSGARVAFWIPKRRAARPQSHRADLPLELALVQRPARVVAGGPHGVEAAVHVRDQDLLAEARLTAASVCESV